MSILDINDLALNLVAKDFTNELPPMMPMPPINGGPTKTSRALAIIHLAAHDAYAKVTGNLQPQLDHLPEPPKTIGKDEATGNAALLGAGISAAKQLYPGFVLDISTETASLTIGINVEALKYGEDVADAWIKARKNDKSELEQLDVDYQIEPGHHRPDPLADPLKPPGLKTLGRNWGQVIPFVIKSVVDDAFLKPPPALDSYEYAAAFDQVIEFGKDDIIRRDDGLRHKAEIGIFWAYDGSNKLGTPPRIYNKVVRAIDEFKNSTNIEQIKILTAINVAMADAGIAAWHWKYAYDLWRPVVGIREAEMGWGTTGKGDRNTHRERQGDRFWLPLGAPNSNGSGPNPTPNFPAYPSGHATFGSACFEVAAALLKKTPEEILVTFVSAEFNGETKDNMGATRPRWEQTFTLSEALEQNKISRIYLGVHWSFDAIGGEIVGKAVADKVIPAFK
jgi:membrane-associated phospholipid phosphatase